MESKQKRIAVLGLGSSGMAAAQLALKHGAGVLVWDESNSGCLEERAAQLRALGATVELGVNSLPQTKVDMIIISPGIAPKSILGKFASQAGCEVLSELEYGWSFMQEIPTIGVTGTNGKTTTTELCSLILNENGIPTCASGNIGYPVSSLALENRKFPVNLFEVSSFQLERIKNFRPRIALLTNITPDHLERYPTMEDYFLTKLEIFSRQGAEDWSVIQRSAAQQILRQTEKSGGKKITLKSRQITYSAETDQADMHVQGGWIVYRGSHGLPEGKWLDIKELKLPGSHNLENAMAALLAAVLSGVPVQQACQSALKFVPSDHRCQLVGVVKGVRYINDSKATNVDATRQALKMVPEGKKTWLIAGGKDKGFDFGGLEDLLSCRVRGAILIGETRERICKEWERHVHCMFANSLGEAVYYAARNAVAGEVVLLSPACSSFDMFKSYAHRGELFREYVEKVKKEIET